MQAPGQIDVGYAVAGRYRILEKLGEGGMGSVWKAEHLALRSHVAVKFIIGESLDDETTRARFMREAQAAASLHSTHVVRILDYGVDGRHPFIVMELLPGESLGARLARAGKLSPAKTLEVMQQVARAISKAHAAGIIHRDLKPDNVFLVDEGDAEIVKVLDFGVAKHLEHRIDEGSARTATGVLVGTPYYMSPEQMRGKREIDGRADVWAMSVIVYECLLGRRPFVASTLAELVLAVCVSERPVPSRIGDVPPGFDAWFAKATSRVLEERFADVRELVESFRELIGAPPTSSAR